MTAQVYVHDDLEDLSATVARRWIDLWGEAVRVRGAFTVALAGGHTPQPLYGRLARRDLDAALDWSRVHVYFGDERPVPWDHPDSNYRMARGVLLDRVPVLPAQVHPIRARLAYIREDALHYGALLSSALPANPHGVPLLDLVLLGMGPDGHVASLFPGSCVLGEKDRHAVAAYADRLKSWRITVTFPVILAARQVFVMVAGADKAAMVLNALGAPGPGEGVPARRLLNHPSVEWHLDRDAARLWQEARL